MSLLPNTEKVEVMRAAPAASAPLFRLALGLSLLAGFLDAAGFIRLGGIFVASPETLSTMFAVGMTGGWAKPVQVCLLAAGIVVGAIAGTRIMSGPAHRPRAAVLGVVVCLLGVGLTLDLANASLWSGLALAMAIGMAHCTLEGTKAPFADAMLVTNQLVQLGESLADRIVGRKPPSVTASLWFALAFLVGAAFAAVGHTFLGAHNLVPAIILSGLLVPLARTNDRNGEPT